MKRQCQTRTSKGSCGADTPIKENFARYTTSGTGELVWGVYATSGSLLSQLELPEVGCILPEIGGRLFLTILLLL